MSNAIGTVVLAIALPSMVLVGGGALMAKLAPRQATSEKPLMQRLGYSVNDARAYWKSFDHAGLLAERAFLKVDLLFPLFYGGAFLASGLILWRALGRPFSVGYIVAPVAVLVLADWTENLVHLHQLARFSARYDLQRGWVGVASTATIAKLSLLGASVVDILLLALAVVTRAAR
jgi:hypothetical protein